MVVAAILRVLIVTGGGTVVTHLVKKARDALFHMRLGGVRGTLSVAMALLRRRGLALALRAVGSLAVLRMLGLELHLSLLDGVDLGSLLHGGLLCLLRVHARPQAANVAGLLFLAANAVRVDESLSLAVVVGRWEEHGRYGGLIEVHVHVRVHVDPRVPAIAKPIKAHIDA